MSYYGNPYQFFGGNASSHLPPQYTGTFPQQSFNFFNATGPSPTGTPRHPYHHPAHPGHQSQAGPFSFSPRHHPHRPFGPEHGFPSRHHFESTDLDEEERATLAHLHSIQQRREAEQASIRRDAEIRARAEEERLATLRRVAEARVARENAIREAIEERHRQKAAIQQAVIEHHRRQQEAAEAQRRAQVEAAIQAKRQAYITAHRARQLEQQKRFEAAVAQKAECAKRCAAKYAQRASRAAADKAKVEYKNEFEALNGTLGGLFGINLINEESKPEAAAEKEGSEQQEKEEIKGDKDKGKQAQNVKFATDSEATAPEPAQSAFPEDVNDLLTQFLGLRVEPTSSDKPAIGSTNKVPEGLNEFLSRFGLVFEPLDINEETKATEPAPAAEAATTPPSPTDKPIADVTVADPPVESLPPVTKSISTAPSATASSSTPPKPAHVDEAPLTSFLNSFTDLPPFVRDILGNVEIAFKEEMGKHQNGEKQDEEEEVNGKGKGVATGEKRDVPIPAPAPAVVEKAESTANDSTTSLSTLGSISDELNLVLESFTFPSTLSFGPTPQSTNAATPALLFNKTNSPYHAQAHKLLQLLLAADGVISAGDKDVRRKRKEVVGAVERALEALEGQRDEVWKVIKEKRENGEIEETEHDGSATSSETSSVVDGTEPIEHIEHAEEVEAPVENVALEQRLETPTGETEENEHNEAEGFEVPSSSASPPDVAEAEKTPIANEDGEFAAQEKHEDGQQETAPDVVGTASRDKEEEGYELL